MTDSMTDEYHALDLFCGLGGFSSAFTDSDSWTVTTVDIEPRFDPDIRADVFDLQPSYFDEEFDVVLASPPCTQFSTAGNHDAWDTNTYAPQTDAARNAIALVFHTVGLIRGLNPDYWFLENPRGRLRWFLGQPTGHVTYCQYGRPYMKPTDLWGNHPSMQYHSCQAGDSCHTSNRSDDGSSAVASMGKTAAQRAKVPRQLSESIRTACEREIIGNAVEQTKLGEVVE